MFSVSADEQFKVLADRFQKAVGLICGLIETGPNCSNPTITAFPHLGFSQKGVVHSIRPYEKIEKFDDGSDEFRTADSDSDFGLVRGSEDEGDPKTAAQRPGINGDYAEKMRNGINGEKNFSSNEGNSGKVT